MTFGQKLQTLRKEKGLTQNDIADQVNVTAQAVSKWENDLASPDIDILIKCSLKEFTDNFNLIYLAKSTDGNTFCDVGKNGGINTSYLGLHVKSWGDNYPIQCMEFVMQNELVVLPEIWLHELAKTIAGNNHSEKWKTYLEINKIDYLHSGYVQWKI